ncbi:hypothetical protein SEA_REDWATTLEHOG_151 [Gordonia phage RedWattleHog]|nr:hypothetical protein SEA_REDWATTLEHOG_151 [Gordonia phage RedWattleHog]
MDELMSGMTEMCGVAHPDNRSDANLITYCYLNDGHEGPHRDPEGRAWVGNFRVTPVNTSPDKDFHDLVARVAAIEEKLDITPESGPKNPAYILGYNILLRSLVDQIENLHQRSDTTGKCVGCHKPWPCPSADAIAEHRALVEDFRARGSLR